MINPRAFSRQSTLYVSPDPRIIMDNQICPMYAQLSLFTKSPLEHSPTTTPYHLYRNDFLCMPEKKPPPLSLLVTYSHSEKMIGSQRCIIKNGKYQVASAQEVGRHSSCMRSVGTKKCCQRLIHHRLYQSQPSNRQAGRHYKNAQCTAVAVPQYVCSTVNMSSSLS